jgi:hypothetical protein
MYSTTIQPDNKLCDLLSGGTNPVAGSSKNTADFSVAGV